MIDWTKYRGITSDSREVYDGFVFFCVPNDLGVATTYINQALAKGASCIVVDEKSQVEGHTRVKDIHKVIADAASEFYPMQPSNVMAVTGTNGKTSTVGFVFQILSLLGKKAATIGTLGVVKESDVIGLDNTTPGAIDMHRYMEGFVIEGIDYAAFEASSHALCQHRVDGLRIKAAAFTNLTQDHLDYHKDMKSYFEAKKILFFELLDESGTAVLNADDESYDELLKCGRKVLSYGKNGNDLKIISVDGSKLCLEILGKKYEIEFPVFGYFQVMNVLCAVGMLIGCGIAVDDIMQCLPKLKAPDGRLEFIGEFKGAKIFVDYAHTPDALEKAINALKPYAKNKTAVLFGCGGDRDATKRPKMGRIASDLADRVYVTDDNPRTEDAAVIRREIMAACPKGIDAGDRGLAIAKAMNDLENGDVLLVAGKGHENYQIVGKTKHHFSDKEEILALMQSF